MLLWLVIALGFIVCSVSWHLWQGITWAEGGSLFAAAALVFTCHMRAIYNEATTDQYLSSGYITSVIHHGAHYYRCGRENKCYEPERWIIEQRPYKAQQYNAIVYSINNGGGTESCRGECSYSYPNNYNSNYHAGADVYPIAVDLGKFNNTSIGETSAIWIPYFNPVQSSDDIVYDDGESIPYFKVDDYNKAHRLIAPNATKAQEEKLEQINAELAIQNISVGLIVTTDGLYFEKLKRAWHQGKANDFVIVVTSIDGKTIRNVNILGWNNYALKENIASTIMGLPSPDLDKMLSVIDKALRQGQGFMLTNFSRYNFLAVKIPNKYYLKIFIFQAIFFVYMLLLLRFNPNTKNNKLPWSKVMKMWDKHFTPPNSNWYLHPFTPSGIFLYIVLPYFASAAMWVNYDSSDFSMKSILKISHHFMAILF